MASKDRFAGVLLFVDKWLAQIENSFNLVAGLLIFVLMCLGVVQVAMRTLFSSPIFGFIDWVEISMVGFAVLSIAFVQRVGGHVRMELLLQHLHGRMLWFAELVGSSIGIFIVAVLIPYSFSHFQRAFQFGDSTIDIELVTWPAKLVVPVALTLLLLRLMTQWCGYLRLLMDPTCEPLVVPTLKKTQEIALEEIRLTDSATRSSTKGN